ncbi:MAG: MerR family transcriptional regulator [Anaerolineae bacterium]|jgi:DNA-binding transcriptional MerR regulator
MDSATVTGYNTGMDAEYTIEELAERAGTSVRTVRYYIAEGIIPGAEARGKAAAYGEEHLVKLLLARRLADRRVLLADIREQVSKLSLEEARALLEQEERQERQRRLSQERSPRDFIADLLAQARNTPSGEPSGPAPSVQSRRLAPSGPAPESLPPGESWRRVELLPGLELHVRSDIVISHADLIRRLIEMARAFRPRR